MNRKILKDELSPLVSHSEWTKEYPDVDREYIWIYPMMRNEAQELERHLSPTSLPRVSRDVAIYVHVGACLFHCPMCPFFHEIIESREKLAGYADAIIQEFLFYENAGLFADLNLRAIYIGGGTGSLLSPDEIGQIIRQVRSSIKSKKEPDISIECHPITVNSDYLRQVLDVGVNRVSFGIQSFDERFLQSLNLKQQPEQSTEILSQAVSLNFNTVAMDLLYRLPGQTISDLRNDLQTTLDLGVSSLSAYSLELSVQQFPTKDQQPSDEVDRQMFYAINDKLSEEGWEHVAQPDYVKHGHQNQEIDVTWAAPQGQWLGLGAGAWSTFNCRLHCNVHDLTSYMRLIREGKMPILRSQPFDLSDAMSRYMVLGARCFNLPGKPFAEAFGVSMFDIFAQEVEMLSDLGLVAIEGDNLRVTKKGKYYVDNISKHFFSASNRCRLQPWGAAAHGAVAESYLHVGGKVA